MRSPERISGEVIIKEDDNYISKNDRVYHRNRMDELYKLTMKLKEKEHKEIKNKMNMITLERKKKEELEFKEKSKKTFMIRNNELLGLQSRKNHLIEKVLKIKDDKKNEFNEEMKIIDECKKELDFMGREEDELLEKINQISELQYEAFDQFGVVKKMGPDEAFNKYNKLFMYSTNMGKNRENTSKDRDLSRDVKYRSGANSSSSDTLSKKFASLSEYNISPQPLSSDYQNPMIRSELSSPVLNKAFFSENSKELSKVYSVQSIKHKW